SHEMANIIAVVRDGLYIRRNKLGEPFFEQVIYKRVVAISSHEKGKRGQISIGSGSLVYVFDNDLFVESVFLIERRRQISGHSSIQEFGDQLFPEPNTGTFIAKHIPHALL